MSKQLKIVSVASETAPFSKSGGLGDVARSLPKAIHRLGHEVIAVTPRYKVIDPKKHKLELIAEHVPIYMEDGTIIKVGFWKGKLMDTLPIYFVENEQYFARHEYIYKSKYPNTRFYIFDLAVLKLLMLLKYQPDIIHCHDWQAGLIPFILRKSLKDHSLFKDTKTIFTIHNLTFQLGKDWWNIPHEKKDDGKSKLPHIKDKDKIEYVNFVKRAIIYANIVNAVSEQYAKEILTKEFGEDLNRILRHREAKLYGIVNGIDYIDFNPSTDPGLVRKYDVESLRSKAHNKRHLQKMFKLPVDPEIPIIGMVTRITEQKGFDLLQEIHEPLLRLNLQLVFFGGGDKRYTKFIEKLQKKYPEKVGAHLKFETKRATQIYAGSDMFLMPSRFEPCGLGNLISLRYGSVPIVRAVGGLVDTIYNFNPQTGRGNGFVFTRYSSADFLIAIVRALETYKYQETWKNLVRKGMMQSFSWEIPAEKYVALYKKALRGSKKPKE